MKYEIIKSYPDVKGEASLPVGTVIKQMTVESHGEYIGFNKKNLFWTVDFVQAHREIFKPI